MKNFFKAVIRSKNTGIIYPSSKFLVRKMTKNIDFTNHRVFVEFGTGNGCLTEALMEQMHPDAVLYSFEMNDAFYAYAIDRFRKDQRVKILQQDAFDFDRFLIDHHHVDCIVSSLPLSLFDRKDVRSLFEKARTQLKPQGQLIQYQYSLDKFFQLRRVFDHVALDYTMRNVPPAFIYTCSKTSVA